MYNQVTPGLAMAIAEVCICDPIANTDGLGSARFFGRVVFVPDEQCPFHGLPGLEQVIKQHLSRVSAQPASYVA
jgi:hypothetical protein